MIPVVFINCDEVNFVEKILCGEKKYETRHFNTLGGLVDRRVLIAETHKGEEPVIRCSAVLKNPKHIDSLGVWGLISTDACIPNYEKWWDFKRPGRWTYELHDVREIVDLHWIEGKRHGRVWMEYEPAPYRMIYDGGYFIDGEDHLSLESAIDSAIDTLIMWEQEEWSEKKWKWDDEKACYHPTKEQIDDWDFMIEVMGCYVVPFDDEICEYASIDDAVWPTNDDLENIGWIYWKE